MHPTPATARAANGPSRTPILVHRTKRHPPGAGNTALVQVKSGGHKPLLLLRLGVDAAILLLLPPCLQREGAAVHFLMCPAQRSHPKVGFNQLFPCCCCTSPGTAKPAALAAASQNSFLASQPAAQAFLPTQLPACRLLHQATGANKKQYQASEHYPLSCLCYNLSRGRRNEAAAIESDMAVLECFCTDAVAGNQRHLHARQEGGNSLL